MKTPKALEEGESTFMNGGGELGSGAMCGGVISQSHYDKYVAENGDPYGIMMAFVMDDENFEMYKRLKAGGTGDRKAATKLFELKARSQV